MTTIVSQDGTVSVNYDYAVKMLYFRPTEAEDVDTGSTREVYAIAAALHGEDDPLVLGFYDTREQAEEVFGQLLANITNDEKHGFVMPD